LEPWLPGPADFHQQPTDIRLRNTAVALATLHLAAQDYAPTAEGATWFACRLGASPAVIERRGRLLQFIGSRPREFDSPANAQQRDLAGELAAALSVLAPRIAAELEPLYSVSVRLHPCLRDVWHDHILFTGDDVTGIVDPSATRTENVASDLSRRWGA
jgi:hypothetical protein